MPDTKKQSVEGEVLYIDTRKISSVKLVPMRFKCWLFGHDWHLHAVSKHEVRDQFDRPLEIFYSIILQECLRCHDFRDIKVRGHFIKQSSETDPEIKELRKMAGIE